MLISKYLLYISGFASLFIVSLIDLQNISINNNKRDIIFQLTIISLCDIKSLLIGLINTYQGVLCWKNVHLKIRVNLKLASFLEDSVARTVNSKFTIILMYLL